MCPLKILILEDSETDAEIVQRLLKKQLAGAEFTVAMSKAAFITALDNFRPGVILADNSLPQFDAADALALVQQKQPETPFILVTGTVSEEFAAGIIKAGADDYILKDRLARLPAAIEAAIKQKKSDRDKQEALLQLTQSEQKYRLLIEQAFDGIISYSLDGKILDCNQTACQFSGYSKDELLSLSVPELFFKEDLAQKPLYFQEHQKAHEGLDYRRLRRKDGSGLELEIGTRMMPDGNLMAIGRDITERKKAAEKLQQSEIRFRALVEKNEGIISLMDKNLQTIYRSESAQRITGWSHDEFELTDPENYMHPEDIAYLQQKIKIVLAYSGIPVPVAFRVRHKRGHFIWLEGVMTNLLADPNVEGIVSNLRDITDRRNAEKILNEEREKFAKIAATSPGLIYSFRKQPGGVFSFPYMSNAVEDLFGFKYDEIANDVQKIFDRMEPVHFNISFTLILLSEETMQPWKSEFLYTHPEKGPVWLEGNSIPMKEADGGTIWHGVITDITERKNAEHKIIQSELRLKAIFDNTSEGFALVNSSGNVETFNSRMKKGIYEFVGKKIATGMSIFGVIDEDRKANFELVFEKVMKGEIVQYDRCFERPGRRTTWINFSMNPAWTDNSIIGMCITGRDITEKKKAEQEKEFAHNNLYALINNTGDLIWSIDREYKLITSNVAFDKAAGKIQQISEDPDDTGTAGIIYQERFREFYKKALAGNTFSEIIHTEAGINNWSEVSFYPIYEGKQVVGTACFSHDITARKKAEEELKRSFAEKQILADRMLTILNTLPANIALLDENGTIIDINESWKDFTEDNGLMGASYGVGVNYIDAAGRMKDKDDAKIVAIGLKKVLGNRIKEFVFEYASDFAAEKKWYRMVATPVQGKKQNGSVVMHIDISKLRRLEHERMESKIQEQKKITQAMILGQEKERNSIGRELHDNLNQILAGINLLLGMLKTKPERLKEYLPLCIEHINLAISENRKIAHELVSPNHSSESLAQQIERICVNMLQTAGLQTRIIKTGFDESLLQDDQKLAIYRVVQEQCTNIIKYAKAREVEFLLYTSGDLLSMSIKDDGQGMPEGKFSDGIGLQNMKSRVSVLNGRLNVDTAPGKGFTLHVEIPL